MSRKFIATILAAAIAVTGFAARPAQASDAETIVKFLGTAATIYIIGNAIKEARSDDDRKHYRDDRHRDKEYRKGRRGLPKRCLLRGEPRRGGTISVLGARCVERNYRHARKLPNRCLAQMDTREKGVRTVYRTRCLRRAGFKVARR